MRCCVNHDDTLTDKRTTHSRVRVHVLCVEVGLGCHVVIGVGRVIVQRHHADVTPSTEFFLVVNFCTCSQTVCCDRQFFPVAIFLHTFAPRKRVI